MRTQKSELAANLWEMKEAEETLRAIRRGAVDAFVVEEPDGHRVYTLQGADLPYSVLVERMQQGAAMLNAEGEIVYCNPSMAELLQVSQESVISQRLEQFVGASDRASYQRMLHVARSGSSEGEMGLCRSDGTLTAANFCFRLLARDVPTIGVLITDLTSQKEQADLAVRLQQLRDEERRGFARHLHDSVGQLVVMLGLNLAKIQPEAHKLSSQAAQSVSQTAAMVNEISDQIRTISHLLHPPLLDEVGLPSALRWYVDGFAERSKVQTTLNIPEDLNRLSPETEIAVFRAVQECLTNVHRHSGSSSCTVKVSRVDHELRVEIRDSGCGIPESKLANVMASGGVGLRGMRERIRRLGGSLSIRSDRNGTEVTATLPITVADGASAGRVVA